MKTILASVLFLGLTLLSCKKETTDSVTSTDSTMTDTTTMMSEPMMAPTDSTGTATSGTATMPADSSMQNRGDSARTTTR